MAALTGKRWPVVGKKLTEEFPYIEAEVRYAVKEYARTATDVVARRTRLAFLNVQAADEALPRIVEIMAKELGWKKDKAKVITFGAYSSISLTHVSHNWSHDSCVLIT